MSRPKLSLILSVSLLMLFVASTSSKAVTFSKENTTVSPESGGGQLPQGRMESARPTPLPQPKTSYEDQHLKKPDGKSNKPEKENKKEQGHPPSIKLQSLFEESPSPSNTVPMASLVRSQKTTMPSLPRTMQAGTENAHFTSSRLIPPSARTIYPYSAVGKLFYTKPGKGEFTCSGAVIKRRLILTAGHCVHKGSGGSDGYFENFIFIPAYGDGPIKEPFKAWKWTNVVTSGDWAMGNGKVPNIADFAILEVDDQLIEGKLRSIGEVVGMFEVKMKALNPNHTTKLGYPSNFDDGEQMHQVSSQHHRAVEPNNVEYGSDMRDGSSGGPWIENFGVPSDGQPILANLVVGVTSYGYDSSAPQVQGSSILDSSFQEILEKACSRRNGNC